MPDDLREILGRADEDGNIPAKEEEQTDPGAEQEDQEDPNETEDEVETTEEEQTEEEEDSDEDPEEDKTDPKKVTKDSSVIKTLRQNAKLAKQEADKVKAEAEAERKFLEKMAAKQGISVEALKKQIEEDEIADEAKTKGMTPEALAAQKTLEEEVRSLREEQQKRDFLSKVDSLQNTMKLTDDQVSEFITKARDSGINLLNPNIKFEDAYYALNRAAIEKQIREDERQKVLKDIERQKNKGPTSTKKTGTGDDSKKGIGDLYADLAKLPDF